MTDAMGILPSLVTGLVLGAVFFGGLWLTVRRGVSSKNPAPVFLISLLVRSGLVLGGFYLVAGGQWERLPACGLGFVTARLIATRLAGPARGHGHAA